jgi:hypothetical protein
MHFLRHKVIGILAMSLGLASVGNVQSAYASSSTTFQYVTTAAQSYVVPAEVTLIYVEARGGDGAGAYSQLACGGSGALVTTTLVVTPGETLDLYVAGRGKPGTGNRLGSNGGWGYGSGGDGDGYGAGGGGGGTAIMRGTTPLVVAGGGGGSGWAAGAIGGSAGTTPTGGADGGGNANAGAGADGTGAGAPGTRPGSSWAAGGNGSPGGSRPSTDYAGTGGGGYGGGGAAVYGSPISGGGGGGSMSAGVSTVISTAPYGVACINGINDNSLRTGAHGYLVITPVDSPVVPTSPSSSDSQSQTFELSFTPEDGTICSNSSQSGTGGTWVTLPGASDCTAPEMRSGATLLGWATAPNFPIDIAKRQVDNGWGAYETFDDTGHITSVFIPAGGATLLSAQGNLYPIWRA